MFPPPPLPPLVRRVAARCADLNTTTIYTISIFMHIVQYIHRLTLLPCTWNLSNKMYNCENKIDVNIVVFANHFGRLGQESYLFYSTWAIFVGWRTRCKDVRQYGFPSLGHSLSSVQNLSRNHQHSLVLSFVWPWLRRWLSSLWTGRSFT